MSLGPPTGNMLNLGGLARDTRAHQMEAGKQSQTPGDSRWARVVKGFEHVVVRVLMALLMIVVSIATVELAWLLLRDLSTTRILLLDVEEIFELFGFFLLVLIGVELLTTLKSYIRAGAIHGEVVLEVALIAIAQKIIVLDTSRSSGMSLIGLAALVLALSAAFWSVRSGRRQGGNPPQ